VVDKYGARRAGLQGQATEWDPSGFWPDVNGQIFKKQYSPFKFVGRLLQSDAAKNYADVGGTAASLGVEGIRRGEENRVQESRRNAASQGLGRGFAAQQETNIRQQGDQAASQTVLAAGLEERSRRFQLAQLMASSLIEANKVRYSKYIQKRLAKKAGRAGLLGAIGNIGGAALGLAGTLIGGPVGGAVGAAAGGALSGATGGGGGGGAAVDPFSQLGIPANTYPIQ